MAVNEAEIVKKHEGWVQTLAAKHARGAGGRAVFDDLVQAGFMGLLAAARRWDGSRGVTLLTYATPWIAESMRRCLNNSVGAVRIPRHRQKERAAFVGVGVAATDDRSRYEDDGVRTVVLSTSPTQEDSLAEHERAAIVRRVISSLSERERQIVEMVVVDGQDYRTVGRRFGMSRSRVDQIVHATLSELRERLVAQLHADTPNEGRTDVPGRGANLADRITAVLSAEPGLHLKALCERTHIKYSSLAGKLGAMTRDGTLVRRDEDGWRYSLASNGGK